MKRFSITQEKFLQWLINDIDDILYWGNRFINDLKKDKKLKVTVEELFNERDSLPGHLFTEYFDEAEIFSFKEDEDIPLDDINLIE